MKAPKANRKPQGLTAGQTPQQSGQLGRESWIV